MKHATDVLGAVVSDDDDSFSAAKTDNDLFEKCLGNSCGGCFSNRTALHPFGETGHVPKHTSPLMPSCNASGSFGNAYMS